MIYGLVLLVAIIGISMYLLLIFRSVPGAVEERLGELEALPQDLGKWRVDTDSEEGRTAAERGERREVRTFFEEGGVFGGGKLVEQVRYRNTETNAIERVEPDRTTKRRRIKRTATGQ